VKQAVRLAIGCIVYTCWRAMAPGRLRAAQEQFFASHSLTFLERQALAFMLFVTRMDTARASSYWAGSAGTRFHAHTDHRVTLEWVAADDFYRRPMLDEFARHARELLRRGASIVEVGCGAGGNLLYLRQHLPGREFRFEGFDVNPEVILSNRRYEADDLHFEVKDGFASDLATRSDLGIIFCAVLMYAQEADIERLLRRVIEGTPGRILIGVSEPTLDPDAARASEHASFALLHGYRRIFRQLDFRLLYESLRQEQGKPSRLYQAVFELTRSP
jgi:SAM-dependent methyltransferase